VYHRTIQQRDACVYNDVKLFTCVGRPAQTNT
jgi:hypothetical protein